MQQMLQRDPARVAEKRHEDMGLYAGHLLPEDLHRLGEIARRYRWPAL